VDIARFFLVLATMLVAAKLLGEAAERIGQPAVLGELLASAWRPI
jgi:Kef-type K+ transport system membrane component KefB